jgi:hypothetical protein
LPDGVGYRERGYMIDIKADGVEIWRYAYRTPSWAS